jgi:hypothetical protein
VNWTSSPDPLLLPPGTYDVYWLQDNSRDRPFLLASGVDVRQGQLVTQSANSGIALQIAPWVPKLGYAGYWSAVRSGDTPDKRVNWTSSPDPLLLPPGTYDVYWLQDNSHDRPILLASGINVEQGHLLTQPADAGIKLDIAPWVPKLGYAGYWSAVRSGDTPDKRVNWTSSADPLLLPPGTYDVYWLQDNSHDRPILLASGVDVRQGQLATEPAKSGIRLSVPAGTPAFGYAGRWGVVHAGDTADKPVNWASTLDPVLLPPGNYDVIWQQDINHQPVKLQQNVTVTDGKLVEIPVQPPN